MKPSSRQDYGERLTNEVIAGLALTETTYRSDLRLPPHAHERAYFCLVLEGAFTESYGPRSRDCRTATLIFHPAGESHADRFYARSRCFDIEIGDEWRDRVRHHPLALDEPKGFQGGLPPRLARRLYSEFRRADALSPLVVEGIALEMLAEASRRPVKEASRVAPRWLINARDLLHEQFAERLTMEQIARAAGVHPVHLAREFRRFYHCTVGDYVRRRRVEFACEVLARSDAPLSEIALAAGFFDQSHFTRTFKQQTGRTPAEFRGRRR